MKWFNPDKKAEIQVEKDTKVEIVAHRKATQKEVQKVKQANKALSDVFEDNNFTIKLVLAAKKH